MPNDVGRTTITPELFPSILDSLSEQIVIIDKNGRIEWVNRAWREFSTDNGGVPAKTLSDINYLQACRPAGESLDPAIQHTFDGITDVIEGRKPSFSCEYPCHSPSEDRWFTMRITPLHGDTSGERFVVSHLNTTARKLSEIALRESHEDLRYEVDVKNRFFSIIAHDLKSPFTSLLGMTTMMSQMADSFSKEKLVEYARDVNDAGERFFELLHNLLDWSRLQMDGGSVNPKHIDVDELVHTCVGVLDPVARDKMISIACQNGGTAIYADRDMAQAIIRNLLTNAIKFTNAHGTVTVSSRISEDQVQIVVADTGVGISADRMADIFSLDTKTSTLGTVGEKGTGLGLPLCKDMLDRNNGNIRLESTVDEGTTFIVTFPASTD